MNILLSIKPRFVELIKKGKKRYEFRKSFSSKDNLEKLERIYIYSSSPVKKVIGSFKPKSIIQEHPKNLWETCKDGAGTTKTGFFGYFRNKTNGVAIEISDLKIFKKPMDPYHEIPNFHAPQNFCYIDEDISEDLID